MTGILDPEDLSAYASKVSPNEIVSIGDFSTVYTNLIEKNDIEHHKSLDFSNVGMPTDNSGGDAAKRLRQFHQTRLYITDYDGMLGHGTAVDGNKRSTYLISANLPEKFSYKVGSEWSAPLSFGNEIGNALMQLGGSDALNQAGNIFKDDLNLGDKFKSLSNRVSTLQIWNGTKPLELSIRIPVIDDGHPNQQGSSVGKHTNLVEALEFLGSLCLPKVKQTEGVDFGFYTPPPSPFNVSAKFTENFGVSAKASNYARIMLQLGGILLIDRVIIKSIQVDYPNTKGMIRHWYESSIVPGESYENGSYLTPLLAEVTINLCTVEALTANTYSKMLWLKQQGDQGKFGTDDTVAIPGTKPFQKFNIQNQTDWRIGQALNKIGNVLTSTVGGSGDKKIS